MHRTTLAFIASLILLSDAGSASTCNANLCATRLAGLVTSGAQGSSVPIPGAHVAIYSASDSTPRLLGAGYSNSAGQFAVSVPQQAPDEIRYAVASKGEIVLTTVMAPVDRPVVRINEMSTVGMGYALAQFIDGHQVQGNKKSLAVAAGMFKNLVAPETGTVSSVLASPPNADQTNARRLMATLSNIIARCVRSSFQKDCAKLFKLTKSESVTPADTLGAIVAIARSPSANVKQIFALSDGVDVFTPALGSEQGPNARNELFRLDAFTLAVKVNATGRKNAQGAELCPFGGPGNLVFDPNGWAWITNNVIQGEPVSANCFFVLKPDGSPSDGHNGTPASPLFGGGVLGQGFGITRDPSGNIWSGNFGWGGANPVGSVSKFSAKGKPLSPSTGFVSTLNRVQGTTADQSGNIWMASYYGNSVQVFPGGNPYTNYPVYQDAENEKPFHIVVDNEGAGWVSYTSSSTLSKFAFTQSGLVKYFTVPIGTNANPKGIGLDTAGNLWATAGSESKIYAFRPDGSQIGAFSGGGVIGPWGLSVDSRDNVWVANFGPTEQLATKYRLSRLCGASTANCPSGLHTGDAISPDTGYTLPSGGDPVLLANGQPLYGNLNIPSYKPLMRSTATAIDMAGNVWVTNNWKPSGLYDIGPSGNPGGDGMIIFVGLAAPVQPGIGQPKAP